MSDESARQASVAAALDMIEPGSIIGLGSGRAVFALTARIGFRWDANPPIKAVAASTATASYAAEAGIELIDLNEVTQLDCVFDGADEIDPQLRLIKGLGAAMLREKLVIALAQRTVILAEDRKLVDRLGQINRVPVEVIPFGSTATLARLQTISADSVLRTVDSGAVITDEGNFIVDVAIPDNADLGAFADQLKLTVGVVEHGLFLDQTTDVLIGYEDGAVKHLAR